MVSILAPPKELIWTRDDVLPLDVFLDLRKCALEADYETVVHLGTPWTGIAPIEPGESFELKKEDIFWLEAEKIMGVALERSGFGFFRINRKTDKPPTYVHADDEISKYSAILYLTPPLFPQSGTAFWRHRKTGMVHWPERHHLEHFGMDDAQQFIDDGMDQTKWEMLRLVEAQPNRLLIFQSRLFHSRYPYFGWGDNPKNARLIVATFFN